jgi:uncharacterized protein (TIGR02145 family)
MKTQVFILFCFLLLSWLIIGCDKSKDDPEIKAELPKVSMGVLGSITTSGVSVEVAVTDDGGADITHRGVCFSTSAGPTIDDDKTTEGTGKGTFTCMVTGLTPGTRYYIKAYATNSKGTGYSSELNFLTTLESVTDYEGNVYQAVKIGEQIWTNENLKSTKYADGTVIKGVYPAGGDEANVPVFGRWYDWYAVMHGAKSSDANPSTVQGVCPDGYHVPSDSEWLELEVFLGMSMEEAITEGYRGNVAGQLKTPMFWMPSPGICNNSTGFTALPAGYRELDGKPNFIGYFWGGFYIATESADTSKVAARQFTGDGNGIWRYSDSKKYGYSVRCVKDE